MTALSLLWWIFIKSFFSSILENEGIITTQEVFNGEIHLGYQAVYILLINVSHIMKILLVLNNGI